MKDCGDHDRVIKKPLELLKLKLRKVLAFRWTQRRSFHEDSEGQTLGECYRERVERVLTRFLNSNLESQGTKS